MHTPKENGETMASVEGPDPVPWPGARYELIADTQGFVEPERAAQIVTERLGTASSWTVDRPERSNVENIFSLECDGSPLEIRARLAGMGVHAEAERIEYVLECNFLLGKQNDGSYQTREVARGSIDDVADAVASLHPLLKSSFDTYCKFETNRPIVSSIEEIERVLRTIR